MAAIHDDTTRCKNSRARLALAVGFVALALLFFGAQPAMALFCGDGILDPGEECDDGNNISGDGCTATCLVENCVDDLSGVTNNCTAEDVRIASIEVEEIDPCSAPFDTAIVRAVANLEAGANERYDIGLFVALDGGVARTGSCLHDWLPPPLNECSQLEFTNGDCGVCSLDTNVACTTDTDCASVGGSCIPPGPYDPLSPETGPFYNAEEETLVVNNLCDGGSCLFGGFPCVEDANCPNSPGDTCGDLEQGILTQRRLFTKVCDLARTVRCEENADCGPDGPCVVTDEIPVTCIDIDGNGKLDVGTCTSWDNNKNIAQDRFETDGFCSVGTCSQDPTQECSEDDDCPGGGNKCEFLVACDNNEFCASQDLGYCVSTLCTTVDATLPNTKAKCNCETIELDVDVPKVLEVRKIAVPFNETGLPDNGEFDLFVSTNGIDSAVCSDGGAAPCSETVGDPNDPDVCPDTDSALNPCTTTVIRVEAGFCSDSGSPCTQSRDCPGDEFCDPSDLRVGETATDANTSLANYTTFIECRDAVGVCSGNDQIPCLDDQICQDAGAGTCAFDPLGSCDTDTTNALVDCETDTDGNPYLPLPISSVETNIFCLIRNEALVPGFFAEVTIVKDGDELSKVGDEVDYTITVENTSTGALAPDLDCTITDPLLGLNENVILEPGVPQTITPTYTVQAGDPDPLVNTATIDCTVVNFPSIAVSDSDDHSVNLFQPAFDVVKTGDALSKVGDDVDYTFTLSNTSSANTPDLTCTATDSLLGVVFGPAVLPAGDTVVNKTRTVLAGDPNPLVNTVTLSCTLPAGFTNVLADAEDSHSVDLFTPAFDVVKTGDELSKVGDDVDYTFTLSNTSSANTPDLTCTATDTLLGEVFSGELPPGDTVLTPTYTVQAGDPNPLVNTVTLSCSLPAGFTNVLEDAEDSHSVDLFEPAFSVTKEGDESSKVGDVVNYTITLSNTSSANTPTLTCTATDTLLGEVFSGELPAGDTVLTPTYTVQAGDPNPLVNTVTLSCSLPAGFTNVLEDAEDSHSVDLFEPAFSVTKEGDESSKVGDVVNYTITLSNTSSANTPTLTCTATDTLLGEVFSGELPAGDTVLTPTYTVLAGDPNPLMNTVTLSCSLPAGFTNVLEDAEDSHSVDLFTPAFDVVKTGDELSKVGDDVDYTFTLSNTSSANTPDLTCTATDTLLGVVFGPAVLPPGDTVVNKTRTVLAGDPDPLVNTVTLSCSLPAGFTNVLEDVSADHSVDLFEPAFSVTKEGDAQAKVGDVVNYTITLTNSSGPGTPALTCTATDTLLGVVFGPAALPAGDTVLTPTYTVQAGDPDPLVNTVTLSCSLPAGFTNLLEDVSADHSVDLFEPAFSVTKEGDAQAKVGDVVNYTITLTNSSGPGTPALTCTATDTLLGVVFGPAALPAGNTVLNPTYTVQAGDPDPLVNTVTLSCSLPAGFTNVLEDVSADHSVDLFEPAFSVTKEGDAQAKVGDVVNYTITLTNSSGPGTPTLICTATDTLLGVVFGPAPLPAGNTVLNPTYTVQAGDPDPLVNTVTLSCSLPAGFTNELEDVSADHSVDLFEPAFSVTKEGDAQAKVGDVVNYTITLTNSSGPGTPALTCTATDTLLGVVFGPAALPAGNTVLNPTYTVQAGDPDPLVNTVTLSCSLPAGFTNELEEVSADHSVDLFEPAFSVTKEGDAQAKVGDVVNYTITLTNSSGPGTPALTCTATDTLLGVVFGPAALPAGNTVLNPTYTVQAGDPDPLVNTVTLSCSLPAGFTNVLEDVSADHSVDLFEPAFSVTKEGDAQAKVGDVVNYTITLTNSSGPGTPTLICTATDTLLGVVFGPAPLPAGNTVLNPTYTVQAGDPDPLVNTVTLSCSLPAGFTNELEDVSADHSVDLFEPAFSVTKEGDAQAKVGDVVNYTITLTNSSGPGTPALTCTATDTLLGVVFGPAALPAGNTVLNPTYTVQAGDPDPLVNTVTLSCSLPAGFTNVLEDVSADHSVDLFEPAFSVTKEGDAQAKVGDVVNYTITLTNSSGPGTPALTCTATDTLLGVVFGPAALPAGNTVLTPTYTVQAGDPDPLVNTVTLSCSLPAGFTNELDDVSADHSVDLFEPAFSVTKEGDAQAKVGDVVNYTITLTNSSGPGTPALTCTATDTLLGVVFGPAALPAGNTVLNPTYTVQAGDPDPLVNTVTLSCSLPAGFTNVLEDVSADHSVDLFEPAFSVTKEGDAQAKVGDVVNYTITLTNSSGPGTPALTCTATDTLLGVVFGPAALPAGNTVLTPTYTVQAGDPDPLVNTVTLSCSLPEGFTNVLEDVSADHSVDLFEPAFSVTKEGDAQAKVGDVVNYTITLTNSSGPGTPALTCTATDTLLGVVFGPAALPAGNTVLNPTYTVQAGDPDPLVNTVTLSCSLPAGFTNELEDVSADHSVDLFEPAFSVTKEGDAQAKVGDVVNYTITLTNSSGPGTPALTCTATDTLLGVVFGPAALPAGNTVLNPTYTVQAGDPDPLVNTVTLSCSLPAGFTNELEEVSADHSVDLFEPAFSVTKEGDAQAKVGDVVNYTITLTNSSGPGTPALTCTATDTLLGVVFGPAALPAGNTVLNPTYTVQAGDPDPLVNTVTLSCSLPAGFTNELEEVSADHSVDLFEPAFSVTKEGDAQAKVGDVVNYTITLTNSSGPGTPALTCTATDTLLGVVFGPAALPAGDTVLNPTYTVQAGDPDPLVNTVTLSCSLPAGFTNELEDVSDDHSVDLFEPAFSVTKEGDAQAKVGDVVNYTITLTNSSGPGTPTLTCTATDTLLGVVFGPAALPAGDTVLNPTYTVQAGDPDPLVNTVTLSCSLPEGFTNELEDVSDDHSVDLFEPAFSVTKEGDAQAKVGDVVNYTITLTNSSGPGTPTLTCTATDTLLGVVFGPAVLSAGDTVLNPTYTVQAGDPDPLVNTVTLSCSLPAGFTNVLEDVSDDHSVDLFEPAFSVTKAGDAQAKVGDVVNYTITLTNSSGPGTPTLTCTATDTLLGVVFGPAALPAGNTVLNPTYTVQAGDPDPLVNTVTLSCSLPAGFTNELEDVSADHSVDLFEPAFSVTKEGDAASKVGDVVNYTITLTNSSGPGTPTLTCTATDTLLGVVFGPAALPAGNTVLNPTYTVQAGDPDPLVNTVTLSCSLPAGFTNVLADAEDSHSVDLVHPSYTVTKTCTNEPVPQDGPATWTVVFTNTGDVALSITAVDAVLGIPRSFSLPKMGDMFSQKTFIVSAPGPFAGQASISNTVTSSAVLAIPGTFTNVIADKMASDTCIVAGEAKITKLTQGLPNEPPNPETRDWRFTLQDCGIDGCQKDDPVIGDVISPPSMLEFGADLVPVQLEPNQTYRLCEVLIPVAWTNTWKGDIDDDGIPETQIPFVPAVNDDPVQDPPGWSNVFDPMFGPPPAIWTNDERCLNFVADAGKTEVFEIDNQFPGGEPRTIGYWKNWDSCSGGGQVNTAIDNCGPTSADRLSGGCALLDDVLQPPGIDIGLLNLQADADVFNCDQGTQDARNILDKRSIDDGRKRASDAAYGLAAQLLAAIANETAGAGVCPEAGQAIIDGQMLLVEIEFNGTGDYFKKRNTSINGYIKQDANDLALLLDSYNNGTLCVP